MKHSMDSEVTVHNRRLILLCVALCVTMLGPTVRAGRIWRGGSRDDADTPPGKAAAHFNKTECFCFTKQRFEGNEARAMPVRFVIGNDVPGHVRTVTLSYTFYDVSEQG